MFFALKMSSADRGSMASDLLFTEVMELDRGGIEEQAGATQQSCEMYSAEERNLPVTVGSDEST